MSKRFLIAIAAAGVAVTVLAALEHSNSGSPALTRSDEPGGTDADAKLARTNPDEYAWQLFFFINRQASDDAAGVPDPQEATLKDDKPGQAAVWEGWALASGEQESEVFNGCNPKPWKSLTNRQEIPGTGSFLSPNLTDSAGNKLAKPTHDETAPNHEQQMLMPIPPKGLVSQVEIRYNRETYESILQDELWSREAIKKKVQDAQDLQKSEFITFPAGAKAVKAAWVEICIGQSTDCADMKRYHWRRVEDYAGTHLYGLAALHIMTKEKGMGNWFWADFIHEDCLSGTNPCSYPSSQTYVGGAKDSTVGSDGTRLETRDTPWQNYRLKGTEIAFVTDGKKNALSDPRIEINAQNPTSCITCHDYASVPAEDLPTLKTENLGFPGAPDESILDKPTPRGSSAANKPTREYIQSDFLWSIEDLSKSQQSCPSK